MSSRLDKLKALLHRVEERRTMPRLRAVPAALGPAAPSNEPARFNEPATAQRVSTLAPERPLKPAPTTPLEDAMADLSPTRGLVPTPVPGQSAGDLVLDDFDAPAPERPTAVRSVSSLPQPAARTTRAPQPPAPAADPFAKDPFASSLPPPPAATVEAPAARESVPTAPPSPVAAVPTLAAAPAPAAAAPIAAPPPLTEPSARIAAPKPPADLAVAKSVSPVRVETPKTFGELVERSLALRVRE